MSTKNGHLGVATATVIVYYFWLVYGMHVFPELKFDKNEYAFVAIYMVLFFATQYIKNNIIGMIVFLIADFLLCWSMFRIEVNRGINALLIRLKLKE